MKENLNAGQYGAKNISADDSSDGFSAAEGLFMNQLVERKPVGVTNPVISHNPIINPYNLPLSHDGNMSADGLTEKDIAPLLAPASEIGRGAYDDNTGYLAQNAMHSGYKTGGGAYDAAGGMTGIHSPVKNHGTENVEKAKTEEGFPVWGYVTIGIVVVAGIAGVAYYFIARKKDK